MTGNDAFHDRIAIKKQSNLIFLTFIFIDIQVDSMFA